MNINEAATGVVDSILHRFKAGAVDPAKYVKDLWTEFQWMTGAQFKDLCFEVSKVMEPYKPPFTKVYIDTCSRLASSKGWKKAARPPAPPPKMTPEQSRAHWLEEIKLLTPSAARTTLRQAKEQKLNMPQEIIAALEAKASQDAPTPSPVSSAAAPAQPPAKKHNRLAELRERRDRARRIVGCERHNSSEYRRLNAADATRHASYCDDCLDLLLDEMLGVPKEVRPEPPVETPKPAEVIEVEAKPFEPPPEPEPEGEAFQPEPDVPPAVAHMPKAQRDELARQADEEGVPF